MDEQSSRWHEITQSAFTHERAALRQVRELLPDRHPYEAWSNFTFISQHGHIREVDLLVATPSGLHLVEIKSFKGRLENRHGTWVQHRPNNRHPRTFDNPLPLADQKAKELKALLVQAARQDRVSIPFVAPAVFLSEPGLDVRLDDSQRHGVYGTETGTVLGKIGSDLLTGPISRTPLSPDFFRALPRLLQRVGIHPTKRSITVGWWQIEPRPYDTGPTWQDHHAEREDMPGEYRRVRIYLYEREGDADKQRSIRAAAEREFRACQGIRHPGLLGPVDLVDHEAGPALLIEQPREALRLDHYMVQHHADLDLPTRLDMIRQLAEAVHYAHERRLVHRALSPRAVIVLPTAGDWTKPQLQVGEWQAAARGLSGSSTVHRLRPSTGAVAHVEAAAAPYLAPDFTDDPDGTVAIDVFGVGAIAYLVLTGRPPAGTRSELLDQLARHGGLHPRAVDDGIPDDLDAVIALATDPVVRDRFADVEQFLEELSAFQRLGEPSGDRADPWDAAPGERLADSDYVVQRVLGTGATARAFLVEHDNTDTVLKVSRSADAVERLAEEATALEDLRHEHVVVRRRSLFPLGSRQAIEIDYAGERSLAHILRDEGALLPDKLQLLGDQLLDALSYLERKGVLHSDIKPDNLGLRSHPKYGQGLVLFDFSLAGAPINDVTAGTRGYIDPFLGSDRRPVYDLHAERYAAAVTLHEMASLELPSWGEDGTNPRFHTEPVTLATELFETGLREPLREFFGKALHRDADKRFTSAAQMREAWQRVFTALDETAPASVSSSGSDDPEELRREAAERATLDTALNAAGLTLRAVAVANRLGADTVGDLLDLRINEVRKARGLSRKTRTELLDRIAAWRTRLVTEPGAITTSELPSDVDGSRLPLDAIVAMLLPKARRRNDTQAAISRLLLGLPDEGGVLPATRWPTSVVVARGTNLTQGRISQVLSARRRAWSDLDVLDTVLGEVVDALVSFRRVAAAEELAEHLLAQHGCSGVEAHPVRMAYAYAVLRAAYEVDWQRDEPRLSLRRHHERVLLALQVGSADPVDTPSDESLLDLAERLADKAGELAAQDPLPTPTAVVRELAARAERTGEVFDEKRLVRLAAAGSGTVLANLRLELYPRDLPVVRALRLAQAGAGMPEGGLTADGVQQRLDNRFPGLDRLPTGRDLAELLTEAGFPVSWDGELYRPRTPETTGVTRVSSSTGSLSHHPIVSGTAASDVDARLVDAAQRGGVRIITVRRKRWAQARAAVEAALGVPVVDVTAAFVAALRDVAREHRIPDFDRVLRADAADSGSREQLNLHRVVELACGALEREWTRQPVLALDALTPLGRYPAGQALLDRLAKRARYGAEDGGLAGPDALVLLCPMGDETTVPRINDYVIRVNTPEEWIIARSPWPPAGILHSLVG
ncbi:BREX system serine/threonine kinase PglW [Saccharothrix longispora]|uniref:BREX system serine/threonine kinase PglW n=1 Tax=Saccharothrix longispora TaxID=33920 RepID=UPI0028FD1851|nr:BREX system serine/threonine kinase PglW [Saccharothrix longispora]MDU0289073.1 BREX system serine/threonine kinase PglW [Saccharothrix longispora]